MTLGYKERFNADENIFLLMGRRALIGLYWRRSIQQYIFWHLLLKCRLCNRFYYNIHKSISHLFFSFKIIP